MSMEKFHLLSVNLNCKSCLFRHNAMLERYLRSYKKIKEPWETYLNYVQFFGSLETPLPPNIRFIVVILDPSDLKSFMHISLRVLPRGLLLEHHTVREVIPA